MRSLRLPVPAQPPLEGLDPDVSPSSGVWWGLPEPVRQRTLVLLARLIARGVVIDDPEIGEREGGR